MTVCCTLWICRRAARDFLTYSSPTWPPIASPHRHFGSLRPVSGNPRAGPTWNHSRHHRNSRNDPQLIRWIFWGSKADVCFLVLFPYGDQSFFGSSSVRNLSPSFSHLRGIPGTLSHTLAAQQNTHVRSAWKRRTVLSFLFRKRQVLSLAPGLKPSAKGFGS